MSDILASLRQPLSILLFCGLAGTGSMLVMASDLTALPVVKIQETSPSQQPPAQQPAKPRKKVFTNEDFGAPPAEEAREQMYKKASEDRAGEEEAWRAEVQAAREALKAAQEQKNAPKEVTPESPAEPKPNVHPDLLKVEELSKPKSSQTATTPSEPETDPVAEAEKRLERLLAQGQDKGFRETPPPPPQPIVEEPKKEEPKKEEKKKPKPAPEEPEVINN